MELTSFTFEEQNLHFFFSARGPVGQHISGLADLVVNQAIVNASGRPGPRIRTGDLVSGIHKEQGEEDDAVFFDVGSSAVHRDQPYPKFLETGEGGAYYPWLKRALVTVFDLHA